MFDVEHTHTHKLERRGTKKTKDKANGTQSFHINIFPFSRMMKIYGVH